MKSKTAYGVRIIDLANKIKFKEVAKALKFHYPETTKNSLERYKEIMEEIASYPIKQIDLDKQLVISLSHAYSYYNKNQRKWIEITALGEEYYCCNMEKKGDKMSYAIEFTRWEIASNWIISKKTIDTYKPAEILAHFLWEMTYIGWTQEPIKKKTKELMKTVDKIQNEIKENKS